MAKEDKKGKMTEKQWNKAGYKLKKDAKGERLWTNGFRQHTAIYYTKNEVRKMTDKQFRAWKQAENKRKYERAKELKTEREKERRKEEERYRQQMEEWKQMHEELQRDSENKLKELEEKALKLVFVHFEDYGYYIYAVPKRVKKGTIGVFSFGDQMISGTVDEEVDPKNVVDAEWFPYGLKTALID